MKARPLPLTALPALALLGAALPALTQSPATPPPPAASPSLAPDAKPNDGSPASATKKAPPVVVIHHADKGMFEEKGKWRILEGHVHIQQGDAHFYADRIRLNEETKTGEAVQVPNIAGGSVGPPTLKDDLNALTSDRMILDFSSPDPRRKVVSAVGNVKFVAQPDPNRKKAPEKENAEKEGAAASSGEAKKERLTRNIDRETVLTCDRLDYFYRSKRAIASGRPKVVQGGRWITGDQAFYYDKDNAVVVTGNVKGEDEKGRSFSADAMTVWMTDEDNIIEAEKFHGAFPLEEEKDVSEGNDSTGRKPPSLDDQPPIPPTGAPNPPL